jgi:hypothetical protein
MMPLIAFVWMAQAAATTVPAPDCSLVPGWRQQGEARTFEPETLFDYMDGNSEGYLAYGFVLMHGVTCVNASGDQLVIDVSTMGDPDHAWGLFIANRDIRTADERLGAAGQVLPRRVTFAKDRYYVEIAASPDRDHRAVLRAFASALEARATGRATPPEAVSWFPTEGLEQGSIRMVPESVLGLRILKAGFIGQYPEGRAFVVTETTSEVAAATLQKLRARFAGATPVTGLADEAFRATDAYLGGLLAFRKGVRVAGVANVAAGADASALARKLAASLP